MIPAGSGKKLVRDEIPALIKARGEDPHWWCDKSDHRSALIEKLHEEVQEFVEGPHIEELADILEVVHALARLLGHSPETLERVRDGKRLARGGFHNGTYLGSRSDSYESGKNSEHRQ